MHFTGGGGWDKCTDERQLGCPLRCTATTRFALENGNHVEMLLSRRRKYIGPACGVGGWGWGWGWEGAVGSPSHIEKNSFGQVQTLVDVDTYGVVGACTIIKIGARSAEETGGRAGEAIRTQFGVPRAILSLCGEGERGGQ